MKKQIFKHRSQNGFTLLELMIASMVFSIVLLAAGAALVQVARMYYKGIITSRTQNTTRTVMDEISRSVQFGGSQIRHAGPFAQGSGEQIEVRAVCIGKTRYTYAINAQINDGVSEGEYANNRIRHALWKDIVADDQCAPTPASMPKLTNAVPSDGGEELLGQHMRLVAFEVPFTDEPADSNLYPVKIGVAYGDNDVFNLTDGLPSTCRGAVVGAQWCAVSILESKVYKRITD